MYKILNAVYPPLDVLVPSTFLRITAFILLQQVALNKVVNIPFTPCNSTTTYAIRRSCVEWASRLVVSACNSILSSFRKALLTATSWQCVSVKNDSLRIGFQVLVINTHTYIKVTSREHRY